MKISRRNRRVPTELEEDMYFSKIADQRYARMKKWISHEEFWAKVLSPARREHQSKTSRDAK